MTANLNISALTDVAAFNAANGSIPLFNQASYSKKLIKGEPAFEFVTEAKKFYKNYRYPIDKTKAV